jgi:hypothetical protein
MAGFDIDFLSGTMANVGDMAGLIIMIGFVAVGLIYVWMVNNRYPTIKIMAFDRGMIINTTRRRIGDMLVKAGLTDLLFNANKLIGEDIKKFQFIRRGGDKVYLAQLGAGGVLLPLQIDIDNGRIYSEGLIVGRQVAMEYVNLIDEVNKTLDKTNPLIVGILTSLPLAIVVLIMVASNLSVMDFMAKQFAPMLSSMDSITGSLTELADKVVVVEDHVNQTTEVVYG